VELADMEIEVPPTDNLTARLRTDPQDPMGQ